MRPLSETKHLNYASPGAGVAQSVTEIWDRDRAIFFLPAGIRAQILHSVHSGCVVHPATCPPLLFSRTKLVEIEADYSSASIAEVHDARSSTSNS